MYKQLQPTIKQGDKLIIGLGDSFTQGVGAYTDATWAEHNGKIDVAVFDPELIKEQYEGSWVNQICQNHLPGWKGINLGHSGTGNRCAIKELYLNPSLRLNLASEVIVVYMLSGIERFDFAHKELDNDQHHFYAMWPNSWDPNCANPELWKAYADVVHSDKFMVVELLLNILEAQEFCRSRGFKLVVTNAFDQRVTRDWITKVFGGVQEAIKNKFNTDPKFFNVEKIADQFDWKTFCYPNGRITFMEILCELEGRAELAMGGFYKYYTSQDLSSEYITNCAHPSRKGHAVIAKELHKWLLANKYV